MIKADRERYRRAFRALLLAEVIFNVTAGVVDDVQTRHLPEPAVDVDGLPLLLLSICFAAAAVLRLVSTIALWRFRLVGRTIFAALALFAYVVPWPVLFAVPLPPSSWLVEYLSTIAMLAEGAVLAMAFTEPIRSALR